MKANQSCYECIQLKQAKQIKNSQIMNGVCAYKHLFFIEYEQASYFSLKRFLFLY